MAHLTKYEQETVVIFNAAEKTAHVTTHMRRIITKLDKNPNAKVLERAMHGQTEGVTYELPVSCISFRRGKIGLMDELEDGGSGDAATPKANAFQCPFPGCNKTLGSKQGIKTHHLKVHGKEMPA